MVLNKTESMAIDWLIKKGYKKNEILRGRAGEPDFICPDKKRFEAKFLYKNKILFSHLQNKEFKDNDTIIVFDRDKFITKFLWKDRKKSIVRIVTLQKPTDNVITVPVRTRDMLRELRKITGMLQCRIVERLVNENYDSLMGERTKKIREAIKDGKN